MDKRADLVSSSGCVSLLAKIFKHWHYPLSHTVAAGFQHLATLR
ncbi:hypothetical protein OSU_2066 [Vibrio cholerae PS15]|nr:hypothetical protein OSU_2066 [Vibrio cholerae PS15]